MSVSGTSNKNINNVNWISFREHFFSSILILNNETNNIEISSEDLASNETLDDKFTKRFKANIPLSLDSNNNLSYRIYYGPTDYETLKEYNLTLENSVDMGWGIFGWLNRFIFFPLFSFLTTYFSYGISIILMTIIVKVSISPLTYKSYLSQIKMKILKPELEVINEKFKDDAILPFRSATINYDSINEVESLFEDRNLYTIALDFYSGILYAVEDLKKLDILVELNVFDTENSVNKILEISNNTKILNSDLIIGPLIPRNFETLSNLEFLESIPKVFPNTRQVI